MSANVIPLRPSDQARATSIQLSEAVRVADEALEAVEALADQIAGVLDESDRLIPDPALFDLLVRSLQRAARIARQSLPAEVS